MHTSPVEKHEIDGIPVFKFHTSDRKAVDHYAVIVEPVLQEHIDQHQDKKPLCYIIDVSESGMFSIQYVTSVIGAVLSKFKYRPQHYLAYLTNNPKDKILVEMINGLTARNMAHTRRIYTPDQLQEAIDWLVEIRDSS